MGRKKRACIPCAAPGCSELIRRREYCIRHYRERVMPKCRVRGCQRHASHFGRCHPHHRSGGRPFKRPRAKRSATEETRVLAWGRIHIVRSAAGVVEAEAPRLDLTPSAVVAELVEAWARGGAKGTSTRAVRRAMRPAVPRAVAVCQAPGCEAPSDGSGLCRTHGLQEERGAPLTPIRPRQHDLRLGSLRLPSAAVARLRLEAGRRGGTLADAIRRAVEAALRDPARLARVTPSPGPTTRSVHSRCRRSSPHS